MKTMIHLLLLFMFSASGAGIPVAWAGDLEEAQRAIRTRQYDQAVELLQRLADDGNPDARYHLAGLYRLGRGVNKDYVKAFELFRLAAMAGHVKSQVALAAMYERGLGTTKDIEAARRWYRQASSQGDVRSAEKLKHLARNTSGASMTIHAIVKAGDVGQLRDYLSSGRPVGVLDDQGRTALFYALEQKRADLARMLIEAGIDLSVRDIHGENILHLVSRYELEGLADMLAGHDLDWNVRDARGNTPLHIAVSRGNTGTIRFLLKRHARTDIRNHAGQTPLELALRSGDDRLLHQFEKMGYRAGISSRDKVAKTGSADQPDSIYYKWPALNVAAWQGDTDRVVSLLARGDSPDELDPDGYTSLGRAVLKGRREIMHLLMDRGASPLKGKDAEHSALMVAAGSDKTDTVYILLDRVHPDQELLDRVLLAIAGSADVKLIDRILSLGADPDARDDRKRSPLTVAVMQGNDSVVERLLHENAAVNITDRQGWTPLVHAIKSGNASIVRLLLDHGANKNVRGSDGMLPIHHAARLDSPDILKLLVQYGADPMARTRSGSSALMMASAAGSLGICRYLVSMRDRVDINAKNKLGNTALMLAAASGHTDIVALLLENDARQDLINVKRESALDQAQMMKHDQIVLLLDEHDRSSGWNMPF